MKTEKRKFGVKHLKPILDKASYENANYTTTEKKQICMDLYYIYAQEEKNEKGN